MTDAAETVTKWMPAIITAKMAGVTTDMLGKIGKKQYKHKRKR